VEVADFYDGGTRRIELEPALDAAQNVDRLFAGARKARRAGLEAGRRLLETLDELERVDEGLRSLQEDPEADLGALADLVPRRGRRQRRRDEPRLPYRAWRTAGGVELRVGRGARDNDDLTFRHSRGNDIWLHVRGRPGAHVVIRNPGPQPAPELLLLAAQLALRHSGVKEGAREEVAWTRVKHVRKPKGLPPGKVMPTQVKVLYVEAASEELRGLEKA
jgi:predicted ribosome quality control (RQC) complex YloA/Tae2 family protein